MNRENNNYLYKYNVSMCYIFMYNIGTSGGPIVPTILLRQLHSTISTYLYILYIPTSTDV